MNDEQLTPADEALRERITELPVHIPCGGLRGPVQRSNPDLWQSCRHEDSPQKWEGVDVSRQYDPCIVCFRATAGGISRWSWLPARTAAPSTTRSPRCGGSGRSRWGGTA